MTTMHPNSDLLSGKLVCPVCRQPLALNADAGAGVLYCTGARRHSFDLSRAGYAPLYLGQKVGGDGKEAVRARTAFLSAGYYAVASGKLFELTKKYLPGAGVVLDAGCGEGYYTNHLAEKADWTVCGFDLSRDGVETAAKNAARRGLSVFYAVGSLFELPLADGSVKAVTNVFAPCCETEFCRVLAPGGVLIVVGAGGQHLMGLKRALYAEVYENADRADLPRNMELLETVCVEDAIRVEGKSQVENLFSMTPYYWRTSPADKEKLAAFDVLETPVSFRFWVFRKK